MLDALIDNTAINIDRVTVLVVNGGGASLSHPFRINKQFAYHRTATRL
jgi:hypothetical protein